MKTDENDGRGLDSDESGGVKSSPTSYRGVWRGVGSILSESVNMCESDECSGLSGGRSDGKLEGVIGVGGAAASRGREHCRTAGVLRSVESIVNGWTIELDRARFGWGGERVAMLRRAVQRSDTNMAKVLSAAAGGAEDRRGSCAGERGGGQAGGNK